MAKLDRLQAEEFGEHIEGNHAVQLKLQSHLAVEEAKWKQRAKQHWLQSGNKNTKLYHMHTNQRRRNNRSLAFLDSHGN